ncbi:MAG TPA: VIT1/CCC1 transporter family protein [Patescibacteria group bacterium]|uniref:Rubrerythrin family protein n=1 Tax=Candidatus Kaiserbacteria bacterium RIFCSPHIGHO2_01_FULL_54_36b TaxID=1798483 RepID=A0A1F6CNG9_9BACT|nr:MAG: rubrerythrin family protein [Candidatus Kaiserbacteria bacterium RIFCSPHIGHO2_01_FULL_54_36b]HLB50911.1 VIT1/CCC1 transporter family protein [Patescibacteria group bacterium]
MDTATIAHFTTQQENEITEHHIYAGLARRAKDEKNRSILEHIAQDELRHYTILRKYTQRDIAPRKRAIFFYTAIVRLFGLTFGLKLMERGEGDAQKIYGSFLTLMPEAADILHDEGEHERALIGTLREEKLKYIGSIVLGLNDALVELLGVLAGLTFAFQNPSLIATAAIITGVAASFSMGASEYLSTKTERATRHPFTAALFTGSAYIITVCILVAPYLLIANPFVSMGIAVASAVVIIGLFNFYISVAQDLSFAKRFGEMIVVSFGVALFSFIIGSLVRTFFGITI